MHDWATHYAGKGWHVFPCWPDAKNPVTSNGLDDATTEPAQLRAWFEGSRNNIAIATGARSGILVVDLDTKKGIDGIANWKALVAANGGNFGQPLVSRTPSGGLHLVYAHVEGARNSQGKLAPGVDVRGEGGYVLEGPSHVIERDGKTGEEIYRGRYEWLSDITEPSAPPAWLAALLVERSARHIGKTEHLPRPDGVPEYELTSEDLEAFAIRESEKRPELAAAASALLVGEPWAESGRFTRAMDLIAALWQWCRREHKAWLVIPGSLVADSCEAVNEQGVKVLTSPAWWRYYVDEYAAKGEGYYQANKPIEVSDEELAEFLGYIKAQEEKACPPLTRAPEPAIPPPPADPKSWIVCTSAGYFMRNAEGDYVGPLSRGEHVVQGLASVVPRSAGLDLEEYVEKNGKSVPVPCPLPQVMASYGTQALGLEYSYTSPRSELRGLTFVQRVARTRDLEPRFNQLIDAWLRMLGGQHQETFLDWLATLTQLDRPSCAVLLKSGPGTGKGMLAAGLARLWSPTGQAVPFEEAFAVFNGSLRSMPLVFADESVRVSKGVGIDAADALKKATGDVTHAVQAKYQNTTSLHGALRVLIATNASGGLDFGGRNPTQADLDALEQRVLFLQPDDTAGEYLRALGGFNHTEAWVKGDGIACHVLWLAANRSVQSGPRLLVEGRGGLSEVLAADSSDARPVLSAILACVLGPGPRDEKAARVHGGQVWVNGSKLREGWANWCRVEDLPDNFKQALDVVRERGSKKKIREAGDNVSMVRVLPGVLMRAAEREGRDDELQAVLDASVSKT